MSKRLKRRLQEKKKHHMIYVTFTRKIQKYLQTFKSFKTWDEFHSLINKNLIVIIVMINKIGKRGQQTKKYERF